MGRLFPLMLMVWLLAAGLTPALANPLAEAIDQAVNQNPLRDDADKARDAHRKPAEVLAFWGIKPGDRVADLAAGSGYYSRMLASLVGAKGEVVAVTSDFIANEPRFADRAAAIAALAKSEANVSNIAGAFDAITLPDGLDSVGIVNFYHDTLWLVYDRAKMNGEIFRALKPGGTFLVIDHEAARHAGTDVGKTLHRIESRALLAEVLAAGFHLVAMGDMHYREDDVLTESAVRRDQRRGKTERFVFLFKKPVE